MLLVVLIFLLFSSLSDAVIYKRTGDKVVIPTGSAAVRITFITWKHNEDIAVEWYGGEPSAFRQFKGCTTVDIFTGDLTISGLTQEHSGSYTAEINNKVAGTTEIQVISPVHKPTVSKLCDAEMTSCTLTCEGDITDAGPIDYSWSIIDVHNYHKGQQFNLTKNDHDRWFQCEMNNPISSEMSEKFLNPFSSSRNRMFIGISVLVVVLILIGLIVGIYIYRKYMSKKGKAAKETHKEIKKLLALVRNRVAEKTHLLTVISNGVVPSLSTEESSNQTPQTSSVVLSISSQTAVMNACETSTLDRTSEKPNDEPEISSKKEEEIKVQVHSSETSESNNQTATTTSENEETLTSVAEKSNESGNLPQKTGETVVLILTSETPESNSQTEESLEEWNEEETTRPQLEEPNQSISVSA